MASLTAAIGFFAGMIDIDPQPLRLNEHFSEYAKCDIDHADVRGQDVAKRALTIAAAGSHNFLMLRTIPSLQDIALDAI